MDASARRTGPNPAMLRRIDPLLGPASAVLLGFATGFFVFAMPADVLAGLGLPPAMTMQPVALALLVALLVGAATWGVFRLLDKAGRRRPVRSAPVQPATAPVLRRTDAHPDAPARRPIFAASDLGTPLDLIDPLPAEETPAVPSPATTEPERAEEASERDPPPSPAEPRASPPPPPAVVETSEPAPPQATVLSYPTVSAAPAPSVEVADPPPSLVQVMNRLEAGLRRKPGSSPGQANAPPAKEVPPYRGDLRAALDGIEQNTAGGP